MPSTPETRITGDGSYTLFDPDSDQCFHSHHGALAEAEHVFIQASRLSEKLLEAKSAGEPLKIIEMGLGTGLNFLLSAREAERHGAEIEYHALELNLLPPATLQELHYSAIDGLSALAPEYIRLISTLDNTLSNTAAASTYQLRTSVGNLHIHHGDALSVELPDSYFNLCYFDAFSPISAPTLWNIDQLKRFHDTLAIGGSWLSYCARGAVRRDLESCGFAVDRLPGPPRKREMLRATRVI